MLGAPLESDGEGGDEDDEDEEEVGAGEGGLGAGEGGTDAEERKSGLSRGGGRGADDALRGVMAQLREELERMTAGDVGDADLAEAPARRRKLRGAATLQALEQSQQLSRLAARMADHWMEDAQRELHARREAAFDRARARLAEVGGGEVQRGSVAA